MAKSWSNFFRSVGEGSGFFESQSFIFPKSPFSVETLDFSVCSICHLSKQESKVLVGDRSLVLGHVELSMIWKYVVPVVESIQQSSAPAESSSLSVVHWLREDMYRTCLSGVAVEFHLNFWQPICPPLIAASVLMVCLALKSL